MMRRMLEATASLRLTVALFAMAMVLIFVGTLAQVQMGVWQAVDAYFRSPVAWINLQLFVPAAAGQAPAISIPFPGGLTIGVLMVANLLAAHALRFKANRRKIGVLVLHAGIIVLLAGEFATGMFADEGMMSIDVGGSSQYVEDIRSTEIAVVDPSPADHDKVVAIPDSLLDPGKTITHEALPFNIEVIEWMPNARLLKANGATPADRGVGIEAIADEMPRVRGVDGSQSDAPAAYVRLHRDGETLGTWMLSAQLMDAQVVEVGGKEYGLTLRYRRNYKPFTLHLLEFNHDKFVGTEVARNFSSRVRLVDEARGTDREVVIWMNNPLRYAGHTFYQASYKPDGSGTVLQVVRNPGAILPYVACAMVGGGMTFHFLMVLFGFLKRPARVKREIEETTPLGWGPRLLPWAVGSVGLLIACSALFRPDAASVYDIRGFAELPVSSGGRIKPMDSAARHALSVAGGRQSVRTEDGRISASRFLLDLMAKPESISDLPVVRVDHPDVLALLGRAPEEGGRIPLSAIEPHWQSVTTQASRAFDVPAKGRDPFQRGVVELYGRVNELLSHSSMLAPYAIPPLGPEGEWQPFHTAFLATGAAMPEGHPAADFDPARMHPAVAFYVAMMTAYSENDPTGFNRAVEGYRALLDRNMSHTMLRSRIEVLFNKAVPFAGALAVYILAFLVTTGAMLLRIRGGETRWAAVSENLRRSAVALIWAAFIVHTLAIIARIWLQGRPPVTNLYSSAIFVGWAAVLMGLLLERTRPIGMAAMGAATIGFATLVIAHNLGTDGDTMQMMQAVLDSNFWLATHVVTIALGYSATFLAGALAIIYLVMGVCTRHLTKERSRALATMVYGVVCFALLLSFVGTVLGGIWADQSWGRFWGWDPKENGAALVVLINAIILHARWGGMIRERGIMVLAVAGNIVTAWSWFGTNMLGVGLHSYGFMDSAVFWMMAFVVSQLALMAMGLLPDTAWRSRRLAAREEF